MSVTPGVLALVVGAALAMTAPPMAVAAGPDAAAVMAVATPTTAGIAATSDAVAGYWTPQRMAHAVTLGTALTAGPRTLGPIDPWQSNTVGQVYFHNPATGHDQRCSASTVASGSGRLVLTAGRCLHGGAGGTFMQNVAFSPTRYNGGVPTRVYASAGSLVPIEWGEQSSLRHDYAFTVLHEPLVHLIGGNHLRVNGGSGWQANSLAYTGYPFHGQFGCPAVARYVNVFTDRRLEVNCPTHDAEAVGGPWLRDFDTNSRIGYVSGLNTERTSAGYHRSPYFTAQMSALYQYADGCRPACP